MTTEANVVCEFSVSVAPSGRTFRAAADESLLAAGLRQDIGLPYGCKDGACGSCKCKLLSGSVVHGKYHSSALSEEDAQAGYVLTCCAQATTDVQLESRQVTPFGAFPIKKLPTRVTSLRRISDDVIVLQLQLPANDNFKYHAGQYVEFILRDGARRCYSMANAPGTAGLEMHIRHMPGGKFTDHVFGAMQEKEILRMEGPFGSFFLRDEPEQPVILLASGTGMAPIKAMLEDMHARGIQRPTTLYWGGRRPTDLYLTDWVEQFARAHSWLRYVPVVSDAQPQDQWQGRTGLVHLAVLQDCPDLSGYQVYACGAPIMVDAARHDFGAKAGLPVDSFYADAFITSADLARA